MRDIEKLLYNSLESYQDLVSVTGYIKDDQVDLLLLLDFIYYVIDEFEDYLTWDDFTKISSILNCLRNTNCLINWDGCRISLCQECGCNK